MKRFIIALCFVLLLIGHFDQVKRIEQLEKDVFQKESLIQILSVHGDAILNVYEVLKADPLFAGKLNEITQKNANRFIR